MRTRSWKLVVYLCIFFGYGFGSHSIVILAQDQSNSSDVTSVGTSQDGSVVTPQNQVVRPYGNIVPLVNMRPQTIALAPDKSFAVVSGRTAELLVFDPGTNKIIQKVPFPNEKQLQTNEKDPSEHLPPDASGQVSFTGLIFSNDGKSIYLSNVNGSIKVFRVTADGNVEPSHTLKLPEANAPRRAAEIPTGLAISSDDSRIYVCGNLSNQLYELEIATGKLLRTWPVGVAPYDVRIVGKHAFVSNWGGGRPKDGDTVGPAGKGTIVKVDPTTHVASEGSISMIALEGESPITETLVGLHPSQMTVTPDHRWVVCANAASDTLSVLNAVTGEWKCNIWMRARPSDLFGAAPNAIVCSDDGTRLYVANGSQNAVGVVRFDTDEPEESRLIGLIPVGWYPGALALDSQRNSLYVANLKGLPTVPRKQTDGTEGFNSHHHNGSVSSFVIPAESELPILSTIVEKCIRRTNILQAALPPRPGQAPKPVPERIGEPSSIEHVVYIIKENRTYDQVFGDLEIGRGRKDLCIFGEEVTPNEHKLAREFPLLDNTYCSGILSADGHQWSTAAISTDYLEKSFSAFARSYPDGMGIDEQDALAYSPVGFIWDNAVLHKKTIRNYGEFMMPDVRWREGKGSGAIKFLDCFQAWRDGNQNVLFGCTPAIESIRTYSPTETVGWDMNVPDQYRADFVIRELKEFESKNEYPNLVIICLPNDHTSGTSPNCPTPRSCMADNDLAFGRIVEALSHSRFWSKMAIFAIEDDPQAGWDHVSGFRTTAFCISPYSRGRGIVSTQYNTTSMLRTMEQILGLPPMNQFDASATPMFDCFLNVADLRPFESVAANIALDEMNPDPKAIRDEILREDAIVSSRINFREIDKAPEDLLNKILWRSMRGSHVEYPSWATGEEDEEEETDDEADEKVD